MQGRLIVIEGIDGAGKTSQRDLLIKYLEANGRQVKSIHFPRHKTPFFGIMVDRYLGGDFGDPTKLDAYISTLIFACDQWEGGKQIKQWLDDGIDVLLDRYATSNFGHQAGKIIDNEKRNQYQDWLNELAFNVFQLPLPDKIFLLDMPGEKAQELIIKRSSSRDEAYKDGHEASLEHLNNAREAFRQASIKYERWIKINSIDENNNLKSLQQIHYEIISKINQDGK